MNDREAEYIIWFRPTGGSKDFPTRRAYRDLHIGTDEGAALVRAGALPASVAEQLDLELANLGQLE